MSFEQFLASCFLGILAGLGTILWRLFVKVGDIQTSVAVIATQGKLDHRTIEDHEDRIRVIEKNPALA